MTLGAVVKVWEIIEDRNAAKRLWQINSAQKLARGMNATGLHFRQYIY